MCDVLVDYEGCYTCGRLQDRSDDTDCSTPSIADGKCMSGVCMSVTGSGGTGGGGTGGTGGSGGTAGMGGMGGAVPCSAPLPSSDAYKVDGYAVFDTRPGGISFATDGTLFVGNVGGPDPQQQTVPVLQVNPDADGILASTNDVRDPDVVIVDTAGFVATAGHVFAGGENMQGIGQLTELSRAPFEIVDGKDILGSCIDNVTVMLFDQSQRLLIGNFDQTMVTAPVCAVQSQDNVVVVSDFILTLPGDLTDAISGIVQEPAGNLFVSQADRVHRFNADGAPVSDDYTTGTALGYGPSGSDFEGLLILRGNVLFRRSDLADDENDEVLLTFTDGTGTANYVAFRGADLYISQIEQKRILRVSTAKLAPTDLGCGN
jgi:hypothetical protein